MERTISSAHWKLFLLNTLLLAVKDNMRDKDEDIYEIAVQYGKSAGITLQDFEEIKHLTVDELIKLLT